MKPTLASALALIVGATLAGTGLAQGRHDERPHGYAAMKARMAVVARTDMPAATGGRHDERPHNPGAVRTAKPSASSPANAAIPAATPAAAPAPTSAAQ